MLQEFILENDFPQWRRCNDGYVLNIETTTGPWAPVVMHVSNCPTLDKAQPGQWREVVDERKLRLLEWARSEKLPPPTDCGTCGGA